MKSTYDIQEIMRYLPHRYPFLLIDRIVRITVKESIVAFKNVTVNEPFFQGHFPGTPIMPGVLILEAMAQAGGILAFESLPEIEKGTLIYFMSMDKVKFRKPVVPGDRIFFNLQFLKKKGRAVKMGGNATVDEKVVAEAEMMAMMGDAP